MDARNAPSFTTAIRGYDREEVDEYVDSLAKALEDLEESEARSRKLQAHLTRLNARIHELEDRIKTETPHTAGALGERITLLLSEAEAGATTAIERAEAEAEAIVAAAQAEADRIRAEIARQRADADDFLRSATERAESQARTIEQEARNAAAVTVAEAERRAAARTRQVEEWEQQVVAHTHAEQALQARAHEEAESAHRLRMAELGAEHHQAVTHLSSVRDALTRLLDSATANPLSKVPVMPPSPEAPVLVEEEAAPEGPGATIDLSEPQPAEARPDEARPADARPAAYDYLDGADHDRGPDDDGGPITAEVEPITASFRPVD